MAVAPAWMADKIIVLDDDDEEEGPQPSCTASTSFAERPAKRDSSLKAQQPAPTHITRSPFATAKKQPHVLQAENEKLFSEFVEHCSTVTQDCPEVLTFLQAKYAKASPDYLSSVEFRNTLGRCLTRAQSHRSKTFVFINELCTVLRKHAVKKRQVPTRVEPGSSTSASTSLQPTSVVFQNKTKGKKDVAVEEAGKPAVEDEQPSTSGLQGNKEDNKEEQQEADKRAKRASRKQIAYLENLLKVYHEEICRLQQTELSLDDMEAEDSLYIQEHKLKRKMMKIYEKLCELKGCSTLTGRVIERRILYTSTRYPEINRRIERFINSPEAHRNPPDYQDILQQVLRANERHNLRLSRKQLNQIALDAFRETGSSMQHRRQLDLAYNFGSPLTDSYKPSSDPALRDPSLHRKLRSNRDVALSRLEEVITKYAVKQDEAEEQERRKRLEKEGSTPEKAKGSKNVNGVEEEEEDDDEEDESSDPDIQEEIEASTQLGGADDNENEASSNEAEQVGDDANKDDQIGDLSGNIKDEEEEAGTSGISPLSDDSNSQTPLSVIPSPRDSPSQSDPTQTNDQISITNGKLTEPEEPADSSSHISATDKSTDISSVAANGTSLPPSPAIILEQSVTHTSNGTSPLPGPRVMRSRKRKREEMASNSQPDIINNNSNNSEVDISLDMGIICCSSPPHGRANTPTQDQVSSSQSTPPPKKNKVNVATQCDPDEIIVLSDTE